MTTTGLQLNKVLCTTDFSALSSEGIEYALNLAKDCGAAVRLVHVYALPAYFAVPDGAYIPSAEHAADRSNEVQRLLDATVAQYGDRDVPLDGVLKLGVSYEEVVKEADSWGADLIVMASHGHTGLAHAILGSVTERVLRLSRCPVLVVRRDNVHD